MPLLALLLSLPLLVLALMPLILIQRYRTGRARRLARPWLATLNVIALLASTALFVVTAAIANIWVPDALAAGALGLAVGSALGAIGMWLSRWEATPHSLHYTPNAWLVLAITLLVTARVCYGLWRGWTWVDSAGTGPSTFIEAFGISGSLAAGATVLGYYLSYGMLVRRRIGHWERGRGARR